MDIEVVGEAESGEEALPQIRKLKPDVVLCDIGLPTMDGYAVAAAIRADPALADTCPDAIYSLAGAATAWTAADSGRLTLDLGTATGTQRLAPAAFVFAAGAGNAASPAASQSRSPPRPRLRHSLPPRRRPSPTRETPPRRGSSRRSRPPA